MPVIDQIAFAESSETLNRPGLRAPLLSSLCQSERATNQSTGRGQHFDDSVAIIPKHVDAADAQTRSISCIDHTVVHAGALIAVAIRYPTNASLFQSCELTKLFAIQHVHFFTSDDHFFGTYKKSVRFEQALRIIVRSEP